MPRKARQLTAAEVRRIKSPGFHAVGGADGLLLQVSPSRSRSWVLRATIAGRVRHMGLGPYPDVSLGDARDKANKARDAIREGRDPIEERRQAKQALASARAKRLTFEEAARRCYEAKAPQWREGPKKRDWLRSLELHAHPHIGKLDVAEIELAHVLKVLKPIWNKKTAVATNVRQRIEAVLTWATVSGYRTGDNPARWTGNLKEVLPAPTKIHKVRHHPALPWDEAPDFMAKLRQREGMAARALEFLILTAARSSEVRLATWDEIDLEGKQWHVPADRIKSGRPHTVPLPDDAVNLLKALPRLDDSPYVFTSNRQGRPLSDMSLSALVKRMEFAATPHGFRSTFKDWARSRTKYADEVSELQLAHVSSDATRAAYARDQLLPQRTRLMRDWAKFLREGTGKSKGKDANNVTSIGTQQAKR